MLLLLLENLLCLWANFSFRAYCKLILFHFIVFMLPFSYSSPWLQQIFSPTLRNYCWLSILTPLDRYSMLGCFLVFDSGLYTYFSRSTTLLKSLSTFCSVLQFVYPNGCPLFLLSWEHIPGEHFLTFIFKVQGLIIGFFFPVLLHNLELLPKL